MKSNEEFLAFYRSALLPGLETLDAERTKMVTYIKWFIAVVIVLLLVILIINIFTDTPIIDVVAVDGQGKPLQGQPEAKSNGGFQLILVSGAIGALGYYFWFIPKRKELEARLKTEAMGKMVKFVDERLQYNHHQGISQGEYQQSKIFVPKVNRYSSDGLISGTFGSTAIRFSMIHSEEEIQRNDGEKKSTEWVTIFKGILFVADFNKNFAGRTVVVTDVAEKMLGSFGTMLQKLNKARDPLIKLENIEFEKAFAVYGTDSVEAHYILSPALMDRMMEFLKRSGKINLSFVDSHIYIAIPASENTNLFEPRFYKSLINFQRFADYTRYLLLATSVVEALNLNNRIWTKE